MPKKLTREAVKNPLNKIVVVGETGVKGFIDFIRTQGVIGLAVGLILGTAVGVVVKSLVDNVIMPPIGLLLGSGDGLKGLKWTIGEAGGDPAIISYGTFLNDLINFLIIALVVYFVFNLLGLTKLDKKEGVMADGSEYKAKLTEEQYDVLFNKATETPFSGEYDQLFKDGEYACAACGTILFDSGKKFDAHCGWPSFYDAKPGAVKFHDDSTLGMQRTEVTCATCGGHLGHVFEGEGFGHPTDQRYCINSLSLQFIPKKV